ncbi:arylamine N-acetyltransferase family protein [Pseudomonas mangiferae]|uniref:arylamine N-acetyltransferase family protein n=1 Tax=Pseudomonas mangiferae TaxID=2593654 RepID=UPI0015B51AFF|nr:arylamine N-acetyltransferase [Pseudomonas mangiferae]
MEPLDLYRQRIGHTGDCAPTLDTLAALQAAHIASIPFENLTPLLGMEVDLDPQALLDKQVSDQRGGYCYEQNLLFLRMLHTLGFRARGLAGRVRWNLADDAPPTPRTHMLILVSLDDGEYIVDVGFGGLTPTGPLRLVPDVVQETPHEPFRLLQDGEGYTLQGLSCDEWKTLYRFDLSEQLEVDYRLASWYLSHCPASLFVNDLMVARALPGVRHSLFNGRYSRQTMGEEKQTRTIANVGELLDLLEGPFGLRVRHLPGVVERLGPLLTEAY